jgi:hypothetical protein
MNPGLLIPIIAVSIPFVAIVMGIGIGMLKVWSNHQQEMARIRWSSRTEMDQASLSQIEALTSEVAQLRDTTTKYDMSVERALEEIRHRLTTVESKTGVAYRPVAQEPEQVVVTPNLGG